MVWKQNYIPLKIRKAGIAEIHAFPLVSKGKGNTRQFEPLKRVPADAAFRYAEIQLGHNGGCWIAVLFDIDDPEFAAQAVYDGKVLAPSWITTRRSSGKQHYSYVLKTPVAKHSRSRAKPRKLLKEIADYMTFALRADRGYSQIVTHNPTGNHHRTIWAHYGGFSLDDLFKQIPHTWQKPKPNKNYSALGRNCALFTDLVKWAGYRRNSDIEALDQAVLLNTQFERPLPELEVIDIAKSVERYRLKWAIEGHDSKFIARQRKKGAVGGAKSKRKPDPHSAQSKRIWDDLGVSRRTYYRHKKAGTLSILQCRKEANDALQKNGTK